MRVTLHRGAFADRYGVPVVLDVLCAFCAGHRPGPGECSPGKKPERCKVQEERGAEDRGTLWIRSRIMPKYVRSVKLRSFQ